MPARQILSALLVGVLVAACGSVQEAPVPAGLAEEVGAARESLRLHEDGPVRSTFSFQAVRCRADGGLLVVFEQANVAFGRSVAYAMQGPDAAPDNWAGGLRVADLEADSEIRHFFSEAPEVACHRRGNPVEM